MIPQEYIQEVVRRNDIEEVIGQYVQLRRRGRTATGDVYKRQVFVDVEDSSLTSLGRAALTSLVQYAMDILYQRKWYAGWYSYTNYILSLIHIFPGRM